MLTRSKKFHRPDFILMISVFLLVIFGLIMISSASAILSYKLFEGKNYVYLQRQALWVFVGIIVLVITQRIDYHVFRKLAPWLLFINLILLVAVFIPGIGFAHGGAQRWIRIFGSLSLQPTEVLKLTIILYLACWLEKKGKGVRDFAYGFLPFIVMISIIAFLIIKQPDIGTMFIISLTAGIMFFVAGANLFQLSLVSAFGIGVLWLLIKNAPYRMARLSVLLDPSKDPGGIGYHVTQALLAIGSGGWWGRGFNQSRQKYLYLPEPIGDSIFAIIAEELGFLRTLLIIIIFMILIYRGFKIAKYAPDVFGRLIAIGITSWIAFQALINISAMTMILPLTGIPLPFISYGGSSLVTLFAAIGILLNISKQTTRS